MQLGKACLIRCKLLFRHAFGGRLRELGKSGIDLIQLALHLVDFALCLRNAAGDPCAHTAQRGVRRSDGRAVAAAKIVEQFPRPALVGRARGRKRVRHSLGEFFKLALTAFQLSPSRGKLFFAAFKLLDAVLVLGEAVFILCPALFVLVQRVFVLFHAVEVLHFAVVELDLCIVQLDARVLELLLAVVVILPAVVELPARII